MRISGQRLVGTESLIKALGGGWDRAETIALPVTAPDPAARSDSEEVEKGAVEEALSVASVIWVRPR